MKGDAVRVDTFLRASRHLVRAATPRPGSWAGQARRLRSLTSRDRHPSRVSFGSDPAPSSLSWKNAQSPNPCAALVTQGRWIAARPSAYDDGMRRRERVAAHLGDRVGAARAWAALDHVRDGLVEAYSPVERPTSTTTPRAPSEARRLSRGRGSRSRHRAPRRTDPSPEHEMLRRTPAREGDARCRLGTVKLHGESDSLVEADDRGSHCLDASSAV